MDPILIYLLMLIIPLIASIKLKITYGKYSKEDSIKGLSGFEVARKILDDNDLRDVYIVETPGNLSDSYDPSRKTVRLSTEVFHGTSISSIAVAAHECGHAIQHKEGYTWMEFRSAIFPVVNIANKIAYICLIVGIILNAFNLILLSVAFTGCALLFQIITLPVEFDASKRAGNIMADLGIIDSSETNGVNKVLKAAAFTYVAGVLSTALQMLYYLSQGERRR